MVTTRRGAKAKATEATEPTNDLISPTSPVKSDDHDGHGSSDPMQINSPPPNVDEYSPPNSPMTIDPTTQFTDQETPTSPKDDYADEDEGEDEDVNEDSAPNSPMHLDPPSDLKDLSTPTPPEGDSETHENIAPKGDLIIQFSDTTTVLVSSSTLSQASAPLEATIKKWRSTHIATTIPTAQEMQMHEADAYTLYRLLRLLHNRPDPGTAEHRMFDIRDLDLRPAVKDGAGHLHQLAILVEKYQCQEALAMTSESLLSEFAFPSARDALGFDQAVQVATAAYLLQQPRYFQLFTKRLATDYDTEWIGFNAKVEFPPSIPPKQATLMIAELDRQSTAGYHELHMAVQDFSFGRCVKHAPSCDDPRPKDLLITRRIAESVGFLGNPWPDSSCVGFSLRHLLHGLWHMERIRRVPWCEHHKQRTQDSVGPERFAQLAMRVDRKVLRGLCLDCTKAGRARCECEANSVPHAGAMRFVHRDSFLFGAGFFASRKHSKRNLTGREASPGYE
jgi:hypothetical protein